MAPSQNSTFNSEQQTSQFVRKDLAHSTLRLALHSSDPLSPFLDSEALLSTHFGLAGEGLA